MKNTLRILVCLFLLSGCASYGAFNNPNATTADKETALCHDAAMGLQLAAIGLSVAGDSDALGYWTQYGAGAQQALSLGCGSIK